MLLRLKRFKSKDKSYNKSLWIVPYSFTFLNAILGFMSIIRSFEGNYKAAAYYIIIAALCDAFDGRLARVFSCTSYFGMELDSLCDAISFCLAPCILLNCWLPLEGSSRIILAFYLCAGLARLAKFNSTIPTVQGFLGLPTTIAACFISSLVLHNQWLSSHIIDFTAHHAAALMLIMIVSILMVLPIPFSSFKENNIKFNISFFIATLLLVAFCAFVRYPFMFAVSASYILVHCLHFVIDLLKKFFHS